MILAGDVGGTSTRLALFDGDIRVPARLERYASRGHEGLVSMVEEFIESCGRCLADVDAAAFGVAGPVRDGCARTTNLPWPVEARRLARALRLDRVELLNDLEANGRGIAVLRDDDLEVLQAGSAEEDGTIAVCSAGTGLGEAFLVSGGEGRRVFPSEGGHADFAPRNEFEIELLRFVARDNEHVSYERVCSGMGLVNCYRFLASLNGAAGLSLDASTISAAAIDGSDQTAGAALDLMISIYGAEAGNLALKTLATGGVYLGGGIPPKILPKLQEGGFLQAFLAKGRLAPLLERMPVRVILNDRTALIGAALAAAC
jgi:glucokinase